MLGVSPPIIFADMVIPTNTESSKLDSAVPRSARSGMPRILVTEDDQVVAQDVAEALESLGYRVVGAVSTGEAAVEAVRRSRPDLVLMDIRLGGSVDGPEAAEKIIRAHGTPVVYLTAHSDRETMQRAIDASAYGYVLKPYTPNELRGAIEVALKRHRLERRLHETEERQERTSEELRQANEHLETLLFSVAHDIRTPLRTIQGFAHHLESEYGEDLPEEAQDFLQRILDAGHHLDLLINDLLDYGRASTESMELQPCDLDDVVSAALSEIDGEIRNRRARIDVASPLPSVLGHRRQLVKTFANLLSNAVKFVPPDTTPRVKIDATTDGERVRVRVEDNGIGIAEDEREEIFELFVRGRRSESYRGTGMGLAIVRQAVERQGGSVRVEDGSDGGSRFCVELVGVE